MKKKKQDDWGSGYGSDKDAPPKRAAGLVNRLREEFWREMDMVPLSIPRYSSIPRTNANLKWLLDQGYDEAVIKASFQVFRGVTDTLALSKDNTCWDVYFRDKKRYLDQAGTARQGARDDNFIHKAGDVAVDNVANTKRRRLIAKQDD